MLLDLSPPTAVRGPSGGALTWSCQRRPASRGRPPGHLDGYELAGEIGRGGTARVYRARHLRLGREVAVKVYRDWDPADAEVVGRLRSEARWTGAVCHHPHIVTVHDYVERPDNAYLVMEYVPRGTLRPLVGRLSLAQVGTALEGVLAGLAHVAEHGIVHRDIKPSNLLVGDDGAVRITDFGIAEAASPAGTRPPSGAQPAAGTPHYLAPEQVIGGSLGPWTDLYSVGLTAFELLVGRKPFADTEDPADLAMRQLTDPVPPVTDVRPQTHPAVAAWVDWLASKAPADRPQSAEEAWRALERILEDLNGPAWRDAGVLPRRMPFVRMAPCRSRVTP